MCIRINLVLLCKMNKQNKLFYYPKNKFEFIKTKPLTIFDHYIVNKQYLNQAKTMPLYRPKKKA